MPSKSAHFTATAKSHQTSTHWQNCLLNLAKINVDFWGCDKSEKPQAENQASEKCTVMSSLTTPALLAYETGKAIQT